MPTTPCPETMLTLEQYMAALLDATQRATHALVTIPTLPPSGTGSDRKTVRVGK